MLPTVVKCLPSLFPTFALRLLASMSVFSIWWALIGAVALFVTYAQLIDPPFSRYVSYCSQVTLNPPRHPCGSCLCSVRSNQRGIYCEACYFWYHTCINMNNDEYARLSHSDEGWCGPKCFKEALPFFDSSDLSLADIQDTSELDSSPPRPSRHNRSRLSSSLVYSTPTAKVFLLIWIRFEPLLLPKLPILSLLSRPGPTIL